MKKIHRFILPAELSHQLRDVLKMEQGEEIVVADGQGVEATAKIISAQHPVQVELMTIKQAAAEPRRNVVLYAAILKRENFELVVQKATEVGVTEIVPVISERTIKLGLKRDRLTKIATEAAEQCGRASVPIIREPMKLAEALIDCARTDQAIVFDTATTLKQAESPKQRPHSSLSVFVGPEGGWTDHEREMFSQNMCRAVSLGPLILRGETAAIIGAYLAVHGGLL